MQIFGRTQVLSEYPIGDCFKRIAALGFDGVEICLEHPGCRPGDLDAARAKVVGEMVAAAGLKGRSVSYHVDYIHNDERFAETMKTIPLTRAFGADTYVFAGSHPQKGEESWRIMVARTREMVKAAEGNGAKLAIEFEPNFVVGNSAAVLRLIGEVGSPALGANADIGHIFLCDPSPADAIASLGKRIFHAHVEGMPKGVHRHVPPYEGDVNLRDYFTWMQSAGFDGPMSLDLYQKDYEAVAPRSIGFIRETWVGVK